jgi:hypothetical protein
VEKQAPPSDAVVMEGLAQRERKVDALCRYLLGRTALSRAGRSRGLVRQPSEGPCAEGAGTTHALPTHSSVPSVNRWYFQTGTVALSSSISA